MYLETMYLALFLRALMSIFRKIILSNESVGCSLSLINFTSSANFTYIGTNSAAVQCTSD